MADGVVAFRTRAGKVLSRNRASGTKADSTSSEPATQPVPRVGALPVSALGNRAAAEFYAKLRATPLPVPEAPKPLQPDAQPKAPLATQPASAPEPATAPKTEDAAPSAGAEEPKGPTGQTATPDPKTAPPKVDATVSEERTDAPIPVTIGGEDGEAAAPEAAPDAASETAAPPVAASEVPAPEVAPAAELPSGSAAEPSGPGPDFAKWRTQTLAAAGSIKVPDPPATATLTSGISAKGTALAGTRTGRRATTKADADAAVSKTPDAKVEVPVNPPPEPVPGAMAKVEATGKRKISDAVLPNLGTSPMGTQAMVQDPAAKLPDPPVQSSHLTQLGKTEAPNQSIPGDPAPEAEACVDGIQQSVAAPVPDMPPGTAVGATIVDTPPPPREALPPLGTAIMKDVIARLLVNPGEQAAPILKAARDEAFPNGVLSRVYETIGDDMLAGVTEALTAQLQRIATDAGITAADMDKAVTQRREKLQKADDAAHGAVQEGKKEAEDAITKTGKEEEAEVDAAADGRNAKTQSILAASVGEDSPQVINLRRDQEISRINRTAGRIKFDYEQAKLRRHAALDQALRLQEKAYDIAARDDQATIDKAATSGSALLDGLKKGEIRNWANDQKRAVGKSVRSLREAVTTETDGFRLDTATAALDAAKSLRDWAAKATGEQQGFFAELFQMYLDWSGQAEAEAELWAQQRAGEARDATISNVNILQSFVTSQGEAVDVEKNEAFKTLSKEQQEVIRTYYAAPAGNRDALGAVAAGLRYRVSGEERGKLIEKLRAEVMAKPYSEADQLDQIAKGENPNFSAEQIADRCYTAMFGGVTGWGTDEDKIFANLSGLSPVAGRAVRAAYNQRPGGRDLDADLRSELGGGELLRAQSALNGDAVTEAVGALHEAMDGLGTDEDTIMKMLRGKSEDERAAIKAEYRRRYGVDLDADLKDEMSGHDLERSDALMEGDTAKADAIAIDQAMHGGFLGLGTDEAQIDSVYADIRNDVASQQIKGEDGKMRPMTSEELEKEVARRNMEVEAKYDARYGNPDDQESAMRSAYESELSGPQLDLANALADNDLAAADAARLEQEKQGILYADDDVINGVLENQYNRSLDALKRDPKVWADREALYKMAREKNWDPYSLAAAEREMDRNLEQAARAGAEANMAKLEAAYDTKYSRWGKGGLDAMIVFNMSGTDREKAQKLREQGGYLTRGQRVDFATRGPGTDEEDFKRATQGLTKAEIEDLNKELKDLKRPTVQEIADEELDGRDGFDMKITLRGVPENIDEEMEQARLKTNWELVNSPVSGHERDVLQARLAKMQNQYNLMKDPNTPKAERDRAMAQFHARGVGVSSAVEQYRADVDAWTDAVATGAALVVGIAVTVATGGIAGAVLGALYAAVAGMTVKAVMKGQAYGAEEMAIDAVVGIIDAAAAAATAGVGNALLRVATAGGKKAGGLATTKLAASLAKLAQSSSRTQRMLAHGIAEGVEGAAGALPSALAGNMLNDKNWEGNPLTNILGGTLMETGFGFALGGGLGSIGGIKMPKPDVPPTPKGSMDLLANRGTPKDRVAAWKAHKAENPDAKMSEFLQAWDKAASDRLAKQTSDVALQKTLRENLMAGLPPAERKALAGFKVEILSKADFARLTRSDSGMAVTVIENGTPRVLLREGAPLSVLREEGIHLRQIADPDLGPLARKLDETRLKDWDKLTLAEKMEAYAIKVDLEIDAQKKLIASLEADIKAGRAGDAGTLSKQIADAEKALGNLEKRAAEVAGMGPLDRIAMARGLRDPPPWLDQPARLFSKAAPPDVSVPTKIKDSTFADTQQFKGLKLETQQVPRPAGRPPVRLSEIDLDKKAQFTIDLPGKGPTNFRVVKGELRIQKGSKWVPAPKGKYNDLSKKVPPFEYKGGKKVHVERPYRDVILVDPANPGVPVSMREEAFVVNSRTLEFTGRWAESGTSISQRGRVAEDLSENISRLNVANPDSPVIASFKVQRPDGTGFDGIEVRLDDKGRPVLTVIEVKDYSGYVSYKTFTAVSTRKGDPPGNLLENLEDLKNRLTPTDAERAAARLKALENMGGPQKLVSPTGDANAHVIAYETELALADIMGKKLGMTAEAYRQTLSAMNAGRIELLIRVLPHTSLGARGTKALLQRLKADWKGAKARDFIKIAMDIRTETMVPNVVRDAKAMAGALGSDLRFTTLADAPFGDAKGNLFAVEQAANLGDAASIAAFADKLATRLSTAIVLPNGTHRELGLVVDLSDHQGDKSALEAAILKALEDALLRRSQSAETLKRVKILTQR